MEKTARRIPRETLPEPLPSEIFDHGRRPEPSDWLSEIPRVEAQLSGRDSSFPNASSFLPRGCSTTTMDSIVLPPSSSPSVSAPCNLPARRSICNAERGAWEVSDGLFDLHPGNSNLDAGGYDCEVAETAFDSEAGQLFLSECDFINWRQNPASVQPEMNTVSEESIGGPGSWDTHRGVITKMYSEEQKPLKEVMEFMGREYGFKHS